MKVPEKEKQETPSECCPIKVPTKSTGTTSDKCEKSASEDTDVLNFQPEPHVPFEQELTYNVDAFQKNDRTVEKILTPPPDFKKALAQIPQPLKEAFKEILNDMYSEDISEKVKASLDIKRSNGKYICEKKAKLQRCSDAKLQGLTSKTASCI